MLPICFWLFPIVGCLKRNLWSGASPFSVVLNFMIATRASQSALSAARWEGGLLIAERAGCSQETWHFSCIHFSDNDMKYVDRFSLCLDQILLNFILFTWFCAMQRNLSPVWVPCLLPLLEFFKKLICIRLKNELNHKFGDNQFFLIVEETSGADCWLTAAGSYGNHDAQWCSEVILCPGSIIVN